MSTSLINVRDLYKTYRLGRVLVPVLRGVNLDVRAGEWLAVVGASGSGKSTLLHLLGGLDHPDKPGITPPTCPACGYSRFGLEAAVCPECGRTMPPRQSGGEVIFQGRSIFRYSALELDRFRASKVGFVFQFYHLLPELTVLENVTVAAMVRQGRLGFRRREQEKRAKFLLDAFGLSHRLAHRPAELSGGERQRVAIARALMNEPDVLLADEPTGNLDRQTGEKILDAIAAVRAQRGQTIVMVTHDSEVAARADRHVRLDDGRVAAG